MLVSVRSSLPSAIIKVGSFLQAINLSFAMPGYFVRHAFAFLIKRVGRKNPSPFAFHGD